MGDPDEPAAGVVGEAVARPLQGGVDQCVLDRVLGGTEVTEATDEGPEDLRRQPAQQVLVGGVQNGSGPEGMGRSSTVSPTPSQTLAAISMARSWEAQSRMA